MGMGVQVALLSVLEAEDLESMFGWLESLVKNPFSEDDSAPVIPGTPSPLRKSSREHASQLPNPPHNVLCAALCKVTPCTVQEHSIDPLNNCHLKGASVFSLSAFHAEPVVRFATRGRDLY